MPTRYGWMDDTSPEAFDAWIELIRKIPPGKKFEQFMDMATMAIQAQEEVVKRRYPEASEREVFLRAAALRLGRETVLKVYGFDAGPDTP